MFHKFFFKRIFNLGSCAVNMLQAPRYLNPALHVRSGPDKWTRGRGQSGDREDP